MKTNFPQLLLNRRGTVAGSSRPGWRTGFSLVEIMVAVTLLSVIILGLMAMFTQTQRAFRLGMNQTDVLESGRIGTDMIVREIEQVTPSYRNATNLYVDIVNYGTQVLPATQPSAPTTRARTNIMQDLFFVTRENQTWRGIGYFVRTNLTGPAQTGYVGTLYRYETNNTVTQFANNPGGLWAGFDKARNGVAVPGVTKFLEGVVNFKVRTFETNGYWITYNIGATNTGTNIFSAFPAAPVDETFFLFSSNAVPASVEIELGILEQQTYERYKSIPVYQAQTNFLNAHAGNVHLFRQRIPIRNVDVTAYQ